MLKILAIAPYENLKSKFDLTAKKFNEIHLESYVGDLDEGVRLVKEKEQDYDVIISRGGTAKEIKTVSSLPVVEVNISILDILRNIKMIENYTQSFVFIGYENITKQVNILAEILDKKIDIITIEEQSEVPEIIAQVKANNYSLIVGDKITTRIARENELNAILIESGEESITDAIEEAITIGNIFVYQSNQSVFEQKFLSQFEITSFIFSADLQLLYTNNTPSNSALLKLVKKTVDKLIGQNSSPNFSYEESGKDLYYIELQRLEEKLFVYCRKERLRMDGLSLTKKEVGQTTDDIKKNSSIFIGNKMKNLTKLLNKNSNLFIYGEKGTGKTSIKNIVMNRKKAKNCWTVDLNAPFTTAE